MLIGAGLLPAPVRIVPRTKSSSGIGSRSNQWSLHTVFSRRSILPLPCMYFAS